MAPSVLALIGATIVFSSFLSGVFGMAGGMVLLGVLLNYFDVATGMILFSIIQLFANGWRVLQWRRYVLWPIFGWYVVGAAISFVGMWTIAFVPDKAMVYLTLGLMPFVVEAVPAAMRPNIEWRGVPFITGVATTIIQILAGVGGLFLDIFFQKSMLDRKTTNATKAVAQSFSHIVRALYFGSLSGVGDPAGDRGHLACAFCYRANDRSRISAVDARDHLRHQRDLSRPCRLVVLESLRRPDVSALAAAQCVRSSKIADLAAAADSPTRSTEHLHLAIERHQAGFHAELRVALPDLLAELRECSFVRLGLHLRVCHLGLAISDPGSAAIAMVDCDDFLDVMQLNRRAEIVPKCLVPVLERGRNDADRRARDDELAELTG